MRSLQFAALVIALLLLSSPYRIAGQELDSRCSLATLFCNSFRDANPTVGAELSPFTAQMVPLQVRAAGGGPLGHRWIQIGTPESAVTISYGPANLPFLDAGQIMIRSQNGEVERVSRWHLLPGSFMTGRLPGAGHAVSKTVYVTATQAQELIRREGRHRFVAPYIPFFHDCHTFVCAALASARGKPALPCYLLFKGHW